jgi:hypothetical protein
LAIVSDSENSTVAASIKAPPRRKLSDMDGN